MTHIALSVKDKTEVDRNDPLEADVLKHCESSGCSRDPGVYRGAHYGQGTGPTHLDDLACRGSEYALLQCKQPGLGVENCNHEEDVGVRCSGECMLTVRHGKA